MSEKYTCSVCGGEFEKPEGYEETALKEMKERYGDIPPEERAIVCDLCFGNNVLKHEKRLLQVIRDLEKRGLRVAGLIAISEDMTEMDLVWGSAEPETVKVLGERLVRALQDNTGTITTATVSDQGLNWEDGASGWKDFLGGDKSWKN